MSSIISSHWEIIHLFQRHKLRTAKSKYCIKMCMFAVHTNTYRLHSYLKQLIQGHVSSWLAKKAQQFSVTITQSQSHRHWLALERLLWLVALISRNEANPWENNTKKTHTYTHSSTTHTTHTTDSDQEGSHGVERSTIFNVNFLWHWGASVAVIVTCQSLLKATVQRNATASHLCMRGGQEGQRKKINYSLETMPSPVICVPLSKCLFSSQWSWLNWSAERGERGKDGVREKEVCVSVWRRDE